MRSEKFFIVKNERSVPERLRQVRAVAGGFGDDWPAHGTSKVAYEMRDRRVIVIANHD
jgi:hypothetical protein